FPSGLGHFAHDSRRDADMPQSHPGLAFMLLESHCHQRLCRPVPGHSVVRRRNRIAFLIRTRIGVDNPLRFDDFAINTRAPKLLALGRSHTEEILASHTKIYLAGGRGEVFRPPPLRHSLRLSPSLPYQLARRVEDARDDDLTIGGVRRATFCVAFGHAFSPYFSTRCFATCADSRLNGRSSPPSDGDSVPPSRRPL